MDNDFTKLRGLRWRKSSASSGAGQCVETAWDAATMRMYVRDTKQNGDGPQLEGHAAEVVTRADRQILVVQEQGDAFFVIHTGQRTRAGASAWVAQTATTG